MHLDGVVGPANLHSPSLLSGSFMVGLRAISHLDDDVHLRSSMLVQWLLWVFNAFFHAFFPCFSMLFDAFLLVLMHLQSIRGIPVILAAAGKISGPSWQLVLGCDYRIASVDTDFLLPIISPPVP